jgi:BirA family biotin operon repressor/biotin-[acetyl-CoA-carboxylase] ligase
MLDEDSLRSIAQTYGGEVVWKDSTGSTNADAIALAERGAPHLSVVAAGHQTAGRGRLGRAWETVPGSSMLVSVVLRPAIEPEAASLIPLLAAICMGEACGGGFGIHTSIKWPNDLVVNDRKLAGILPEAKVSGGALEYVVVGVGVNLYQRTEDFPSELQDRATSVVLEGGSPNEGEERSAMSTYLWGYSLYDLATQEARVRLVRNARGFCSTIGREVRATTTDGREIVGTAVDLDERGGLVIEADGARETVAFGEVHHLR